MISNTFENSEQWNSTKLVTIHATEIMNVFQKLNLFRTSVSDFEHKIREGWHETNDLNIGNIRHVTKYPILEDFEMIYNGPHFFVSNPFYKTPRKICSQNSHYDTIDLTQLDVNYLSRTNYVSLNVDKDYVSNLKAFKIGVDDTGKLEYSNWLEYYK